MKLAIQCPGTEPEYIVRLWLQDYGTGRIALMASDGRGVDQTLLILRGDGTSERPPSVRPEMGFRLDTEGRLDCCGKRP